MQPRYDRSRAHLREAGLLDRPACIEADANALSEGLRVLIDRIGYDGWDVPDVITRGVAVLKCRATLYGYDDTDYY